MKRTKKEAMKRALKQNKARKKKTMRNNVTAFGSLFFFVFLLAGCGQKLGDEEIYLGGEVIEKGDKIIVEGKSNLLPGSRLTGELLVDDGEKVLADSSEVVD